MADEKMTAGENLSEYANDYLIEDAFEGYVGVACVDMMFVKFFDGTKPQWLQCVKNDGYYYCRLDDKDFSEVDEDDEDYEEGYFHSINLYDFHGISTYGVESDEFNASLNEATDLNAVRLIRYMKSLMDMNYRKVDEYIKKTVGKKLSEINIAVG